MIGYGTQIINKKTDTIHIVDEIEVINNETLVFTQDVKCFPLSEVEKYPNLEKIHSTDDESLALLVIKSCDNFPSMKENYQEILENVFKSHDISKKNPPKLTISPRDNFPAMKENYQEILDNVFKTHDMSKKNLPKKNILQKIYHFFK